MGPFRVTTAPQGVLNFGTECAFAGHRVQRLVFQHHLAVQKIANAFLLRVSTTYLSERNLARRIFGRRTLKIFVTARCNIF